MKAPGAYERALFPPRHPAQCPVAIGGQRVLLTNTRLSTGRLDLNESEARFPEARGQPIRMSPGGRDWGRSVGRAGLPAGRTTQRVFTTKEDPRL